LQRDVDTVSSRQPLAAASVTRVQFGTAEAVDQWARYRPTSVAAYVSGTPWTYAELNGLAAATAAKVAAFASDQQRVAVACGSKLPLLAAILGVLRTGRSVVVVNTGLAEDIIRINLRDAAVETLMHDERHRHLGALVSSSATMPTRALTGTSIPPLVRRGPSDEWGVLYSSGTTGIPKGIVRSHESIVTELLGWCLELGLTRHSRFYVGRPIYYGGGLVLALATLLVGGAAILNDHELGGSLEEIWTDYQRTLAVAPVDFAFFIPDQLRSFLRNDIGHRPPSARTILTMGQSITGAEKQQVVEAFGCEIVESWGNTESLGTITDPEDVRLRPDSIGRPFLTDELSVVDDECRPVRAFELGRLAGSESAGFLQYCNRPTETAHAKRESLILSEDIGYVDENGFFYVKGRLQDGVVLPNGSTVFVQQLETELRALPMVQDCCVIASSHAGGEVGLLVALVGASPQPEGVLEDVVRRQLSTSGVASMEIRILGELPRVPSGKVDRLAIQKGFDYAA